jgi:hypothetical protein
MTDQSEVPTKLPAGRSRDFVRGLLAGVMLAALTVGFMAAGNRSQNPVAVIDAILARGVQLDERVARVAPNVRRSLLCTALNIVMEARGEPDAGQIAVAWVTRTRSQERDLTACDVVFEQSQFSWTSYPLKRIVQVASANEQTLLEAQGYAWGVLVDGIPDPTHGANQFYAHGMIRPPAWVRQTVPSSRVVIGGHTFSRIPVRRPWTVRGALP